MKVLLLVDVPGVGKSGEVIEKPNGYAQNFLIKKGLAKIASTDAVLKHEEKSQKTLRQQAQQQKELQHLQRKIEAQKLVILQPAGKNNVPANAIRSSDIADLLTQKIKHKITKDMVQLKHPLKTFGAHEIKIHIGPNTFAHLNVTISAQQQ